MLFSRKPFRAKVNWLMFWRHRWTVLNILNQVAHGRQSDAIFVAHYYGGCDEVGIDFYRAARAIINAPEVDA